MRERREFIEAYYGDASKYNPFIDYDKKTGPAGKLIDHIGQELQKVENGGPGLSGEIIVRPTPIDDFEESGSDADKNEGSDEKGPVKSDVESPAPQVSDEKNEVAP